MADNNDDNDMSSSTESEISEPTAAVTLTHNANSDSALAGSVSLDTGL